MPSPGDKVPFTIRPGRFLVTPEKRPLLAGASFPSPVQRKDDALVPKMSTNKRAPNPRLRPPAAASAINMPTATHGVVRRGAGADCAARLGKTTAGSP